MQSHRIKNKPYVHTIKQVNKKQTQNTLNTYKEAHKMGESLW